jgi:hypothetical protein
MTKMIGAGTVLITLMVSTITTAGAQSASDVPKDPVAVGYLNLHKRHPDGLEGPQEFNRFSLEEALSRLNQMRGFLSSFERLTDRVRDRLRPDELRTIGNTESDMQMIGFHNIPLEVEGLLLKQEYQLRQEQYELAQLKYAQNRINANELARARAAYEKATTQFQLFWDTKLPSD